MAKATTKEDIKKLGTILGIWAHPDDETFTAAGILATAVKNGQKVVCVTATKGEGGVQDESKWLASQLGDIRVEELKAGLKILGIETHHWLEFKDGQCRSNDETGIQQIQDLIEQYQPDTILTFGSDGLTGHDDHKAVCAWALEANKKSGKAVVYHAVTTKEQYEPHMRQLDEKLNIFFNIEKPNLMQASDCDIYFELTPELKDVKYNALKVMPSQTDIMLSSFDKDTICSALSPEAFVKGK